MISPHLKGNHSVQKPINSPERPIGSADFLPADKSHIKYISFDGQPLKIGQPIYQIGSSTEYRVFLQKGTVIDFINDGRIRINLEVSNKNVKYHSDVMVQPNQVCIDPKYLVQDWIINIKRKLEIELPAVMQSLYDIWKDNWPNEEIKIESVGEGLSENIEI